MVTKESARVLINNLVLGSLINREYSNQFARGGAKIGATINVRKPPRLVGRNGSAIAVEAATETSVALTLDQQPGCDLEFSDVNLLLSIDEFKKRFIRPAVSTVSNRIDVLAAALYKKVANATGTPGTVPTSLRDAYMLAGAYMDGEATPEDGQRCMVISPMMQIYIVDALKGLFQATQAIADQYRKGRMGSAVNFEWYMDQNVPTHTVGVYVAAAPKVDGASQTGASILTKTWTSGDIVNEGDIVTFAGVNAVNPQNRTSNGYLRQFVVRAPGATASGGGAMTIPIYPNLVATGAQQTVDASPANNAAVTVLGASGTVSKNGLAFHPDAFIMGSADMDLPNGTDMAERVASDKLGLSVRLIRDYVITTDSRPLRLDVLCGFAALYPELACRITSGA